MNRAAVIIGVNKTGNLPTLADAVGGARQVEHWALAQGMARDLVVVHTDESEPVNLYDLKRTINQLRERGTIDQLLVYFAGHGVNKNLCEYWLLSDAPTDTQAAVNVEGSVALARRSGIPHVVVISDACRTAAEGIEAQAVTGGEVFPNDPGGGLEAPVDIFFAAALGKPSLEVKDPRDSSGAFKALYTGALVDALSGVEIERDLVEAVAGDEGYGVIRPWPLKKYLVAELPRRIRRKGLPLNTVQVPDARITSPPDTWLARVPLLARGPVMRGGGTLGPSAAPPMTLQDASGSLVSDMLRIRGALDVRLEGLELTTRGRMSMADELARDAALVATQFGPTRFESQCGFKIRGAHLRDASSAGAEVAFLSPELLRVSVPNEKPAANVLLRFADGTGVILPAIKGFVGALTFVDGELGDVAYEPSEGTERWQAYQDSAQEMRSLRAVIASAARLGAFRLEGGNALELAQRMQRLKIQDPSLALYAAYAYHDLQEHGRIAVIARHLQQDLHLRLFDIDLLARASRAPAPGDAPDDVFPGVPLLAQGWALLDAYRVQLPGGLADIRRHLLPSLWTQFDAAGTALVRDVVMSGNV